MERPDVEVERSSQSKFDRTLALMAASAAVVLVVVVSVVAFQGLGEQPSDAEAASAIARLEFVAPEGEGELFVGGGEYQIESVEVIGMTLQRDATGSLYEMGLQSDYYVVEAVVTATNGSVRATRYCTVTLGQEESFSASWVALTGIVESGTTYEALVGLGADAVEGDLATDTSEVLAAAGEGLQALYDGGSVEVDEGTFDAEAQTTTFVISLAKETNLWGLSGTVTVVYAFDGGTWELREATATDEADDPTYQALLGTWVASSSAQVASGEGSCAAGQTYGIELVIESVDDETLMVSGTVSLVAHYHDALDEDADSTAGDTRLEDVTFEVVLQEGYSASEGSVSGTGVAGFLGGSVIVDVGEGGLVELQLALVDDADGGHLVAYVLTGYVAPEEDEEADSAETDDAETDGDAEAAETDGSDGDAADGDEEDGLFDATFGDVYSLVAR